MAANPPVPSNQGNTVLAAIERQKLEFDKKKLVHDRWWHEDDLVNHRITWLLQTQGVIGAAYAFLRYRETDIEAGVVQGITSANKNPYLENIHQFERVLQALGATSSMCILIGIIVACSAQRILKRSHGFVDVNDRTTFWGHFTAIAMPAVSVLAWVLSWIV